MIDTGAGQYVTVQVSSIAFDSLAIVFTNLNWVTGVNPATLSVTKNGTLPFFFDLPDVDIVVDVYGTTAVTSQLIARHVAGSVFSLDQAGEYGTEKSKLANLYGRNNIQLDPAPIADAPYYFNRYRALVANSFSTSSNIPVLASGLFTLTASVPEPASWAMMVLGYGSIDATLRRRKAPARARPA